MVIKTGTLSWPQYCGQSLLSESVTFTFWASLFMYPSKSPKMISLKMILLIKGIFLPSLLSPEILHVFHSCVSIVKVLTSAQLKKRDWYDPPTFKQQSGYQDNESQERVQKEIPMKLSTHSFHFYDWSDSVGVLRQLWVYVSLEILSVNTLLRPFEYM